MNLAKISANGQITVPVEIRRQLGLKSGDKLIPAVDHAEKLIRDAKDQPILNAAIVSDVDIILTGDKDFLSLDMEHPQHLAGINAEVLAAVNTDPEAPIFERADYGIVDEVRYGEGR